jgi:hypothetical protein
LLKKETNVIYSHFFKGIKDLHISMVAGIDVQFKIAATPELIMTKGYDTVLVATGAGPIVSKMPGADGSNIFKILTAYSNKKSLGKDVVIIDAGLKPRMDEAVKFTGSAGQVLLIGDCTGKNDTIQ